LQEVYDPIADSWSVYGTWEGATSDLAAFAIGTDLYVVGGYDVTDFAFTAQTAMFKIDTTLDELSLEAAEPLNTGRGDIFAAVADNHAYVTGGFTHEDSWCSPHASVERIDLANPSAGWEVVESTAYNRGDKALVHMNGFIYAVGGETKEGCDGEASGTTKPVEHVEVYDVSTGTWVEDTVIPEETFRFVAVGHEASDSIFIFGGQNYHDETCDCYPISDEVLKFTDSSWVIDILDDVNGSGPGFKPGLSAGAGLASLFTAAMLFMYI
jgi:N-acetylneuraminic acid mutarotase